MGPMNFLLGGRRALLVLAGVWAAFFVTRSAAGGDDPPRYKLQVGQHLIYRVTEDASIDDDPKDGNRTFRTTNTTWHLDVVSQNSDGSWRIVFREEPCYTHITVPLHWTWPDTFVALATLRQLGLHRQEYVWDGYVDVDAAGTITENRTTMLASDPSIFFPPIPADGRRGTTWETILPLSGLQRKLHALPSHVTGQVWQFTEEPIGQLDANYRLSHSRDYVFDCDRGYVQRAITTTTQRAKKPEDHDEITIERLNLVESGQASDDEAALWSKEAALYFPASEQYLTLLMRGEQIDFAHTEELMSQAKTLLEDLDRRVTLPTFKQMIAGKLKEHERESRFAISTAEEFAPLLGKPSPDWSTEMLDGTPKSLTDYRGRVVLLDFWYRGCGWCVRAMPQINQISQDFAAQDVSVLGMNNDRDPDDARFVIDHLKLTYATLKNEHGEEQINSKYQIRAWPTLVLIDRAGVIRMFHCGYSPTLRRDLGDKIRELLAEAPSK